MHPSGKIKVGPNGGFVFALKKSSHWAPEEEEAGDFLRAVRQLVNSGYRQRDDCKLLNPELKESAKESRHKKGTCRLPGANKMVVLMDLLVDFRIRCFP